ncbi:Protein CHLOROPLAST IMPORT APPARATUS 2 [Quillaja saponaria]|uniref:Protein CHLOROPLAST IMPORT APPARATUS 2 n=1 Tax=Quillaja saponaria TaxID=32244 RepID=A0AAD7LTX3_QUISA|nr:Protein CHLOROPLAST IMPORT APPARATUS 2 [Quillaja saponaria]
MGYKSILRSPKKEDQQQVPDTISSTKVEDHEEHAAMEEFEGILGSEDDYENDGHGQLNWDFMELENRSKLMFLGDEQSLYEKVVQRENGIEDIEKRVSLKLNLNYQLVLDAWSDRGPLWAGDDSLSIPSNGYYMGEVPVMEEERARREASVLRYKEKRQTRLFSKKIRYQVRKLNADKRPRLKGRFVKRV